MVRTPFLRAFATLALAFIAIAAPAAAQASVESRTSTAVDDFSYAWWDASYEVGLDQQGRSFMHVTETLVARFPEYDQNRGIVRGLTTFYEGASTETRVIGVTDENGNPVPYETDKDSGVLYVLTGTDDYVHGITTYVIEYVMRDVILSTEPADGSSMPTVDEFYWDLLPLESTQPIERFSADITFDAELTAALTGDTRCYQGASGSRDECVLHGPITDGSTATFLVESGGRAPGDGVTVAIGFQAGTATQPPARMSDLAGDLAPYIAAAAAIGFTVGGWLAIRAFRRRRRIATGIVVAQYDVPDSLPPLLAGVMINGPENVIAAQILHLAVRGNLRIEEGARTGELRLRRLPAVPAPDQLDAYALEALFVNADAEGLVSLPTADLPTADFSFAARMTALQQNGPVAAHLRGLTEQVRVRTAIILQWCANGIAVLGVTIGIWEAVSARITAVMGLVAAFTATLIMIPLSFFAFSKQTVHTAEGARTNEYLLGVKEFIRVAEADRLRMLQSYSGAERRADGTVDVIHVYERLLPYAILFGMEDEWGDVLEQAYTREQQQGVPWMFTSTSFALRTQLTSLITTSSAVTGSSSSGGSSGGGFSGGGGGGGFSGGR